MFESLMQTLSIFDDSKWGRIIVDLLSESLSDGCEEELEAAFEELVSGSDDSEELGLPSGS